MALEAGGAAHEVFAAHRLHSLIEAGVPDSTIHRTGVRLFGADRYSEISSAIDKREDIRTQRIAFSLRALHTSGFYDDPGDRRRTMTNIEEMCIAYMDRFDWSRQLPIVLNADSEQEVVGIEIPIDVTVEFILHDGSVERYRFIGRADGIHWKDETQTAIRIHENKTASRLGDAWEASHLMSHQHTGYMIGLSTLLERTIRDTLVLGSALPLPKSFALGGLSRVPVTRQDYEIIDWFDWFLHTVHIHDRYAHDPTNAPHYTHSCNRYFRPCAFISFCASPPEDRQQMIDEMVDEVWSPLDDEGSGD